MEPVKDVSLREEGPRAQGAGLKLDSLVGASVLPEEQRGPRRRRSGVSPSFPCSNQSLETGKHIFRGCRLGN